MFIHSFEVPCTLTVISDLIMWCDPTLKMMKECQAVIIFHCLRSGILSVKIQLTLRGDFILKYVTRLKKQSKVESVDTYDTSTNTYIYVLAHTWKQFSKQQRYTFYEYAPCMFLYLLTWKLDNNYQGSMNTFGCNYRLINTTISHRLSVSHIL